VIARESFDGKFEHYARLYTCILDGRTGAEVARLPVYGKYGIAISPDGGFVAVVTDEPGDKGSVLPTVHIHDSVSGARLASVVHDRIPKGRRQVLLSGCAVAFTSDGKYLVTTGMVTKVWSLSR
jgi:DNA-binding beta-propeller fold protein YncE